MNINWIMGVIMATTGMIGMFGDEPMVSGLFWIAAAIFFVNQGNSVQ